MVIAAINYSRHTKEGVHLLWQAKDGMNEVGSEAMKRQFEESDQRGEMLVASWKYSATLASGDQVYPGGTDAEVLEEILGPRCKNASLPGHPD